MAGHRCGGFSLFELVMIIVVVSIAAVSLLGLFGESARSLGRNESVQTAAQFAQEKAEQVMADRRDADRGYDYVIAGNYPAESPVSGYPAYTRNVSITAYGGGGSPCPSAVNCKNVTVTVSESGTVLAQVMVMLAEY